MPSNWSRRRLLQLGGLSAVSGLSGCASLPLVGSLGFYLRNYTDKAYKARIEIQIHGRTAFEQTCQLPAAKQLPTGKGIEPHVRTETPALSSIPAGVTYSVSLFFDGEETETLDTTMDCTSREDQPMDEEIDINIGFNGNYGVQITDTSC